MRVFIFVSYDLRCVHNYIYMHACRPYATLMCVHHFVCACVCTCMHVHVGICMYIIIMAGMPVFTWLATSSRKGADGL